jgi:hypothetical protein
VPTHEHLVAVARALELPEDVAEPSARPFALAAREQGPSSPFPCCPCCREWGHDPAEEIIDETHRVLLGIGWPGASMLQNGIVDNGVESRSVDGRA